MKKQNRMIVCLIVEGAYPYIVGGVSIWLHQLIANLPEIDFILWTIVPEKNQPYKFDIPKNVIDIREISLSDKLRKGTRKRHVRSQWHVIDDFHENISVSNLDQFERFYRQFAKEEPGALSSENVFKDLQGWELIKKKYNLNHPISPFVEYYWSWRAVHIPIFQMMQAEVPKADIYHAISTGYAGLLSAIAKVKTRKPVLLTEHGIYAKEREIEVNQSELYVGYQKRMWKKNFQSLARLTYTYADLIIALFRRSQETQIEMGAPAEKCMVIPNGIRVQEFQNKRKKPHQGLNVGFIGRMVAIKDVKNFVLAAKIIKDEIPESHFYLIGPYDEQKKYYQELLILIDNLNLNRSITFTGKVDVKDYFPILDVLCLSSIKESQPLSLIESLIAGVPVVATDVGDVSDILKNDGIVVPPKSPDKLAEGVVRFANDTAFRQTCIQRGRTRAINDYDLDQLIQQYGDIYRAYYSEAEEKWRA